MNPARDFGVGEGTLSLNDDGSWALELSLNGRILRLFNDGEIQKGSVFDNPISIFDEGTWTVDESSGEILLSNAGGVQRLQASPNGEVLTVVNTEQRLFEGLAPTFYLTFISDAVYIQLPE